MSFLNQLNKPILPKFPIPMKMLPNQGTKNPYNLLDNPATAATALPLLQNQLNLDLAANLNLSTAAAEFLSKASLPSLTLDNKLATALAAAAAAANVNVNNTTTNAAASALASTSDAANLNLSSTSALNPAALPPALQSLTNSLMFQTLPPNLMATTLANASNKLKTKSIAKSKSKTKSKINTNTNTNTNANATNNNLATTSTIGLLPTPAQLQALHKKALAATSTSTKTTKNNKEHHADDEEEEIDIVSDDGFDDFR